MNLGIGIDIVYIPKISEGIREYGIDYLKKFCTSREIEYCNESANPALPAAARFAAKEAAMKALAIGWADGIEPVQFEVVKETSGQPTLIAHELAAQIIKEKGIKTISISLSHDEDYAAAIVLFED